jgi:hypothetical protein
MTKRFSNPQREQVEAEWKSITTRNFTGAELELFDEKVKRYNYLRTRRDLEKFYVEMGAARYCFPPNQHTIMFKFDEKNPSFLAIDRIDNKILQWSKWRQKRFPMARIADHDRMSRALAESQTIQHHSDADFSFPGE